MNSRGRGRCASCGAPVFWAVMRSGRAMPCEPSAVDFWPGPGDGRFVVDGEVVAGSTSQISLLQGRARKGLIPHWAFCPEADEHRRG